MGPSASEIWSKALRAAEAETTKQGFEAWLSSIVGVRISQTEFVIQAPSQFHAEWIEDRYGKLLQEKISEAAGRPMTVSYQAARENAASSEFPQPAQTGVPEYTASVPEPPPFSEKLNGRYTFDRFVVGSNNEFAVAACTAVAERPAARYNPLFVYGGVGLGKTHLIHAIGNYLYEHAPGLRVAYVPTERFTNELVTSIQTGTTADFRRRYRRIDLLLIDDIHFLEGKERTQEEFFHTFNTLYDAQKQVVLTSDRPPATLQGLERRLVSRFGWGLVADIKPPDYETRVAIVRAKAAYDRLSLDDRVVDFVARSCTSSVREMEGAIVKLLAFSSLTNREIDIGLAQEALADAIPQKEGETSLPTAEKILESASAAWDVDSADVISKRRTRDVMIPRQVSMYLIREILDISLARVGKMFGGRDHSTVIHSVRKVENLIHTDAEFAELVRKLREDILRGTS